MVDFVKQIQRVHNVHLRHQIYDLDRDAETILNQVQHKVHDILVFSIAPQIP
jgi:predicted transcriptional regulator